MKTINEVMADYHRIDDALMESGGEITEEIQAMLDDHDATFEAKVDQYAGYIAHLKAQNAEIDGRIKQLQARKKTNGNIVESMRDRLLYAMQSENRKKVRTVQYTASVKTIQCATVDTERIPDTLYGDLTAKGWLTYERKFDKAAIKKEFAGEDFVLTEEKPTLSLR